MPAPKQLLKGLLPPVVWSALGRLKRGYLDTRTLRPADPSRLPRIEITPAATYPHVEMTVTTAQGSITESLHTSHLCLAKVISELEFETVLDVGGGTGPHARILRHVGKQVTAVEILPGFPADHHGNYIELDLGRRFELIWCSHILEHQRNPGLFLEKLFHDLEDGGVLALTVPDKAYATLALGHCNVYNSLLLIYNLVCAGFDCRDAQLKCYDGNLSVIVRKRNNGLERISFATTPFPPPDGHARAIGHDVDVFKFFPAGPRYFDSISGEVDQLNW